VSHDTWIHRIARATIVRPLMGTRITPNQLTGVRLVCGLAAAGALSLGASPWPDVGAALFVVSMLLDRADGDLARLTERVSPQGHRFDLVADALCNAVVFLGLGIGLRHGAYGPWAVAMGLAAGLAVAAVLVLVIRAERLRGAGAAEIGTFSGFDADDAMVSIPIAVWLGWSQGLLLAAAIGAPAFALLFAWLFRRSLITPTGRSR